MSELIRDILGQLDDDPNRPGLKDTPTRVVKAWLEMTSGRHLDPADILTTTFDLDDAEPVRYGGSVRLDGIEFCSLCEHHLMPFFGVASVEYTPGPSGKVVGVSKLTRLVDCFARRLQMQERMTQQIADALIEHLEASHVVVKVEGTHCCMVARGVNRRPVMTTLIERGVRSV